MTDNEVIDDAKRFAYGMPDNATDTDKKNFVSYCMHVYKSDIYKYNDLAEYSENIIYFTAKYLILVDIVTRRRLRDMLRERGVFCE